MNDVINLENGVSDYEAAVAGKALRKRRDHHQSEKRYRILQPIWHRADMRYYGVGSEVTLSHLSDDEIHTLLENQVVMEVE